MKTKYNNITLSWRYKTFSFYSYYSRNIKKCLNNGLYGKVVELINDLFILERSLSKSVRVPAKKSYVAGAQAPNMTVAKEIVIDKVIDDSAD
ncbi:MAG: hypothetical protein ATN31_08010 [Candidatus Epulonipiscioides saccharophilum]|nr:MAG: hypothetical protein ATN31_08010 [Epulopiscium sp. AS2M-Bin001]